MVLARALVHRLHNKCPSGEERICYAKVLRLDAWVFSVKSDLGVPKRTFSPRANGTAANTQNPGNCAVRPASRALVKPNQLAGRKWTACARRRLIHRKDLITRIIWKEKRLSPKQGSV